MKNNSLTYLSFIFCWLITYSNTNAQGKKNCEYNCFQSSVSRSETDVNGCVQYEIDVTYSGDCESALSHYTVAIPTCGSVSNITNTENWNIEMTDPDPTTGLIGFKIDDISNFGESEGPSSFKVFFTLCGDADDCEELNCWSPTVAYKAGQCVTYDTLEIQCHKLEASIEKQDLSCYESNDGVLSVVVSEGTEPFTYEWSNGENTQQITNLSAGDYAVTITDGHGEMLELEGTISQPENIIVEGEIVQSDCSGSSNGAIDISVTGTTGSITYSWSNGATTEDISELSAGSYTIQIIDDTRCSISASYLVTNKTEIGITGVVTNASCGNDSGAINITIDGGVSPYSYLWSNGSTEEDLEGLEVGSYQVTVADANGCQTSESFSVRLVNTLSLGAVVTKTGCVEDNSGTIDLRVFGGEEPYSFEWSNGEITEDVLGLAYGDYSVTVTDAAGCTRSLNLFVTQERIIASANITQPTCYGDTDGAISMTTSSGEAPFTFVWSNGETGNEATELSAGFYSVTITDGSGCSSAFSYFLSSPSELTSSFTINSTSCGVEGSYGIDLSVQGGTSPYTYAWTTGDLSQNLSGLSSGIYGVIIIDANGCTTEEEIVVEASPVELACLIEPITSGVDCNSAENLMSTLSDADHYSWEVVSADGSWVISGGSNTSEIIYTSGNENTSAVFTLTVSKNGCEQSCSYEIQSCTSTDDGGGDGGDGGDGNDNDGGDDDGGDDDTDIDPECGEGYSSNVTLGSIEENCYSYQVIVDYDGNAKHALSHYSLAVPCGDISNANNSEGWKMSIGSKDPTTGLWGIKVDDIEGFGEGASPDSFTFNFTVCASDEECKEMLEGWEAIAAYKAGQCVTYDTLNLIDDVDIVSNSISAYPNPFSNSLTIEVELAQSSTSSLMIYNKEGELVVEVFAGDLLGGFKREFTINSDTWPSGVYYYKLNTNEEHITKKLLLIK